MLNQCLLLSLTILINFGKSQDLTRVSNHLLSNILKKKYKYLLITTSHSSFEKGVWSNSLPRKRSKNTLTQNSKQTNIFIRKLNQRFLHLSLSTTGEHNTEVTLSYLSIHTHMHEESTEVTLSYLSIHNHRNEDSTDVTLRCRI